MKFSVVIPVYKKVEELQKNLIHNAPYLSGCEIIIVNDYPDAQITSKEISEKNLDIKIINNAKNLGFGGAVNRGVSAAGNALVFLLNSDVLLENRSFLETARYFENDSDLFAIALAQKEKDGKLVGRNEVYFASGLFHHRGLPYPKETNHLLKNGWAEGGSSIFSRTKFLELGGFDENYAPFYWEDVDLSYQAKQKGWNVYFDPSSIVAHHHESTISSFFTRSEINKIAFRNQIYFTKKFARGLQRVSFLIFLARRKIKTIL